VGIGDPGCVWFGNVRDVYCKTFELTYSDKPADVDLSVTFLLNGEPQELALTGEGPVYSATIEVPHPYEITEIKWWADGPGGLVLLGVTEDETLTGDKINCFEYEPPENGAIHVYKYEDANGNQEYDEGEKMLPGWEFSLDLPLPDEDAIAFLGIGITDENGEIVFVDLEPGVYVVTETLKGGLDQHDGLVRRGRGAVRARDGAVVRQQGEGSGAGYRPCHHEGRRPRRGRARRDGRVHAHVLEQQRHPGDRLTITDDFDERYMRVENAAGGVVSDGRSPGRSLGRSRRPTASGPSSMRCG